MTATDVAFEPPRRLHLSAKTRRHMSDEHRAQVDAIDASRMRPPLMERLELALSTKGSAAGYESDGDEYPQLAVPATFGFDESADERCVVFGRHYSEPVRQASPSADIYAMSSSAAANKKRCDKDNAREPAATALPSHRVVSVRSTAAPSSSSLDVDEDGVIDLCAEFKKASVATSAGGGGGGMPLHMAVRKVQNHPDLHAVHISHEYADADTMAARAVRLGTFNDKTREFTCELGVERTAFRVLDLSKEQVCDAVREACAALGARDAKRGQL